MAKREPLREAVNVPDAMERDKLVRRMAKLRAGVALDLATYEHWNRANPHEQPIDTSFEVAFLAYCDGKGPMPTPPKEPR